MRAALSILLLFTCATALSAFPSPGNNRLDEQGNPHGEWVVYLDRNEQVTNVDSLMSYYLLIQYDHGKITGSSSEHYRSGQLFYSGPMVSGNPPLWGDGLFTFYNPDSTVQKTLTLTNGIPNGPAMFYEHGECVGQGDYAQGLRSGEWLEIDDGKEYRGSYVRDLKQGLWTVRQNGAIVAQGQFIDDLRTGRWDFYTENGKTRATGNYTADQRMGEWKEWFPDGSYAVGKYVDDKQDGLWIYYSQLGKLLFQGNYRQGQREGEWTTYNERGRPLRIVTYQNGKTISERDADFGK